MMGIPEILLARELKDFWKEPKKIMEERLTVNAPSGERLSVKLLMA